jgi:hypothetical protein
LRVLFIPIEGGIILPGDEKMRFYKCSLCNTESSSGIPPCACNQPYFIIDLSSVALNF